MDTQERIQALMQRGIMAAKAGKKVEARQMFVRVTELDEGHINAWLWLSGVVKTHDERRLCLENVLTLDPQHKAAQKGLRLLEQIAPSTIETTPTCPHCEAPLPPSGKTCPACQQWLLVSCPACAEYVDVIETQCPACGFALGDYHQGLTYYLTLANAYWEQKQVSQFDDMLAYILEQAQSDTARLLTCAQLYEKAQQWEAAETTYRRVIELAPEKATAYLQLGALYRQHGLLDGALDLYEQALAKLGDHPPTLFALAQTLLAQDVTSKETVSQAADLLQRVLRAQQGHTEAHLLLARVYHTQQNPALAERHCQRAIDLTDENTPLGREARRALAKIRPQLDYELNQGWNEVFRRTIGFILPLVLAAWTNARLTIIGISFGAWMALMVGSLGAYLWVSALDVPKNPWMQILFGEEGAETATQRYIVGIPGAGLWLLAFAVIMAKI